jgi:DNA-binding NarL/FixJ family response regulator
VTNSIRVLTVDDHPLLRSGIGTLLALEPDMIVVGEAADGQEAIQQFRRHRPDVTLMDLLTRTASAATSSSSARCGAATARCSTGAPCAGNRPIIPHDKVGRL